MAAWIRLLHPNGDSIVVSASRWRDALGLAEGHGWVPRGSDRPPISFDEPDRSWTGGYAAPQGQCVAACDARALSEALGASSQRSVRALHEFCGRGGFLIEEYNRSMRGDLYWLRVRLSVFVSGLVKAISRLRPHRPGDPFARVRVPVPVRPRDLNGAIALDEP